MNDRQYQYEQFGMNGEQTSPGSRALFFVKQPSVPDYAGAFNVAIVR